MPDLIESLQGRDLGHLRIVAEMWGLSLKAPDARTGLQLLSASLLDRSSIKLVLEELPPESRQAIDDLSANGYRLPFSLFTKRYGVIREIGPAKRDRERIYQNPISTAEVLWYRALVGRSFMIGPHGPEEYAYIPMDLAALLPLKTNKVERVFGRIAISDEYGSNALANDHILDHACTYLAGLRSGYSEEFISGFLNACGLASLSIRPFLRSLLTNMGLIDIDGMPQPAKTRKFLEAERGEALAMLTKAWLKSTFINELQLIPGLLFEGEWKNDSFRSRQALLEMLLASPGGNPGIQGKAEIDSKVKEYSWVSIQSFIESIRVNYPDFQRPAGDYDSWFIRSAPDGAYLRGFEHWDQVDGTLVAYLILGPMHWLGLLDLSFPTMVSWEAALLLNRQIGAFRFSQWAAMLLNDHVPPIVITSERVRITANSNGNVHVPRQASRVMRYQIARFCNWVDKNAEEYRYALSPTSLERARRQGLKVTHLISLLQNYAEAVPPNLVRAIERWDEKGSEATIEKVTLLRVRSPDQIQAIRASRAARFLGDVVGPTAVLVKPGAIEIVLSVLAELGYLGEYRWEVEQTGN